MINSHNSADISKAKTKHVLSYYTDKPINLCKPIYKVSFPCQTVKVLDERHPDPIWHDLR